MKKKINIIISCITFFLCIITSMICYANIPNEVNKENLELTLKKVAEQADVEITDISEDVISMKIEDQNYNLKYNLKNNPQFISEINIEKGMSYEEYYEKTENLLVPHTLAYTAVADIRGIEYENAMPYFMFSYVSSSMNMNTESENVILINDLNGVTKEETDNPNVFYTSEFGDRIMEYVDKTYKESTISDANQLNSYELKFEKKNITEKSCQLVTTLTVIKDALVKDSSQDEQNGETTGENSSNEQSENIVIDNNIKNEGIILNNNESNSSKLPQTGVTPIIYILISISVVVICFMLIKLKQYKDI